MKRKRNHMYAFYLSEEEARIFEEKVRRLGTNRSDFLRTLILYGCIYEIDTSYLDEYNRQIAAIGNNINQIALNANISRSVTQKEIKILKKGFEELCQLQRSILLQTPSLHQLLTSASQPKQ